MISASFISMWFGWFLVVMFGDYSSKHVMNHFDYIGAFLFLIGMACLFCRLIYLAIKNLP